MKDSNLKILNGPSTLLNVIGIIIFNNFIIILISDLFCLRVIIKMPTDSQNNFEIN